MVLNRLGLLAALGLCVVGVRAAERPARADDAGDAQGIALFRSGRFAEAYRDWAVAAQAGDGRAARLLGVMYDSGEGVPQDRGQALRWYERAAELGDAAGMFNVAVSYDGGTGVPRDGATAARWYARAAARHFGRAEYNLALMYETGDGVRHDPAAASRLFRAAASHGIAAARAHLPATQEVMLQLPPPNDDALFLSAQRALLSRTPADAARAAALFQQAATQDSPAGQMAAYDLAWCYENGVGVAANRSQAYALYVHVAANADDPALRRLAEAGALEARGLAPPAGLALPRGSATPPAIRSAAPGTPAGRPNAPLD